MIPSGVKEGRLPLFDKYLHNALKLGLRDMTMVRGSHRFRIVRDNNGKPFLEILAI
jgi:hypothetical protein